MVVMALDHTRDYFHEAAFLFSPTDPERTTLSIFFTRWITHFCAPAFSLLAGMSAFMVGLRKSKAELSGFLFKRGIWLVFVELFIVTFGWHFDIQFNNFVLQTIWSLGISMIVLAGLIYMPIKMILAFSCLLIFGHNLLDNVHFGDNLLWSVLHESNSFKIAGGRNLVVVYPLIPWIGVMSLGYCLGTLYERSYDAVKRRKILNITGMGALLFFVILLVINKYGDPMPWVWYDNASQTFMSMFNMTKYPPSLLYLLITLGLSLLFLAHSEGFKGKWVAFFCTFGRVPFFYYILHIYVVHLLALVVAGLAGLGWDALLLPSFSNMEPALKVYGIGLWGVYLVWIIVVAVLYPLCKRFDRYKQGHKENWWVSYL